MKGVTLNDGGWTEGDGGKIAYFSTEKKYNLLPFVVLQCLKGSKLKSLDCIGYRTFLKKM